MPHAYVAADAWKFARTWRPHRIPLYCCATADGAIVLDVETLRYFGVRRDALEQLKQDREVIETVAPPLVDTLAAQASSVPAASVRKTHVYRFLAAYCYVSAALARSRLEPTIRRFQRHNVAPAKSLSFADHHVLVLAFTKLRPWFYTAAGQCLRDSLMLTEFLQRCGAKPTLVLGVKTRPFAAHAWVQVGPYVANGTVENVATYTPILAI